MKKIYFLVLALGLFTSVNAQIVTIPDVNFKAKLLAASPSNTIAKNLSNVYFKIDANSNGQIETSEALQVRYLDVSSSMISSLTGIEYFTNISILLCNANQLTSINVSSNTSLFDLRCENNLLTGLNLSSNTALFTLGCNNNQLTSLNLNSNTALSNLNCSNNQLTNLNLNNNTALFSLQCGNNFLTNLSISSNTGLVYFYCNNNQLTSLNVNNNSALSYLICNNNQLTSLNVSSNTALSDLRCYNNLLTGLNLSSNPSLSVVDCNNNQLTTLNVNGNVNLQNLYCHNNQLTTLFIKNGMSEALNISGNPNLNFICSDEIQVENINLILASLGYINCQANSYCSFTPGGVYYRIQGSNKFDSNNNGCDVADLVLPNLKFNISDGTNSGVLISNATGNFSIPVIAATHTIAPVFENPAYFTASPSTINVTFPTQASPFTQNFCITANGVHPDLEVVLLPIIGARPGFDAKYKVVYKNKGNTTQSGTVNLTFNDTVLDFVSANPVTATQTVNNLSWNFTNLLPFETREITLTLNVNSPMETPAVNGGDVLNYTTSITSLATDDMPSDNTFVLHQTVINSFDPNDKTCLEGATIAPAKVGDYVHYMIRFENNGTANAQNIVVKDMIDTDKFDVTSLVAMKGSHPFVTRITETNKVEFIFENINLPFNDANNDGYVAFKIKTKPTLVLGNTFSNTASIYFDYNFPIVTNTATTTIAALSRQDFEFSNYFNVYPNPVSDVLNIATKETIEVSSITIYNTLGQLVLVIPNAKDTKTVDVSNLTSGNYFIKMNSDKGVSNTKFIKN